MSGDLLRRAADAMVAEAERLEVLDTAATAGLWVRSGAGVYVNDSAVCCAIAGHGAPDFRALHADLIAHRRNTLARDAATLRATADLLRTESVFPESLQAPGPLAIARTFLGEVTP